MCAVCEGIRRSSFVPQVIVAVPMLCEFPNMVTPDCVAAFLRLVDPCECALYIRTCGLWLNGSSFSVRHVRLTHPSPLSRRSPRPRRSPIGAAAHSVGASAGYANHFNAAGRRSKGFAVCAALKVHGCCGVPRGGARVVFAV